MLARDVESPGRPAQLPAGPCAPTRAQESSGKIESAQGSRHKELPKTNKSYVWFCFFFQEKEYPIFHVNRDNLLNKILSFVIFLFFSSNVGVVLKYLRYVRHWKNKPAWSRGTDGFCV